MYTKAYPTTTTTITTYDYIAVYMSKQNTNHIFGHSRAIEQQKKWKSINRIIFNILTGRQYYRGADENAQNINFAP